jgi:ADP-ribose diphosphatase
MSEKTPTPNALPSILNITPFVREQPMEKLDLRFSNGAEREFYRAVSQSNPAVIVVAMPDADTVLLTREYACGLHRYELGLVRGRIDEGESVLAAANRELQEEAGFAARRLNLVRNLSLAPSFMTHEIHLVLARDLHPSRLEGDEPEAIEVIPWPLADIEALALRDDFSEGRALGALLAVRGFLQAEQRTAAATGGKP